MFKFKPTKKVIIGSSLTLVILLIGFFVYQLFNPNLFIITENENQRAVVLTQEKYILNIHRFDFFRPNYIVITKKATKDSEVVPELGVQVGYFKRKWLVFFEPENGTFVGGKSVNYSLNDVIHVSNIFDLYTYNPYPDKFIGSFGLGGKNAKEIEDEVSKPREIILSNENAYFEDKGVSWGEYKKVEDFNFLKVGSTRSQIQEIIGKANKGVSPGEASKKFELVYFLDSSSLNFISLAFDEDALDKPNQAMLQEIYLVKKDRTFVEIPTKPDGTFDFESVKSQWE